MLQNFAQKPFFQQNHKTSLEYSYNKDFQQLKTEAPSINCFKQKFSLQGCSSSISLQQKNLFEKQRQIFSHYLIAETQRKRQRVFLKMIKHYKSRIQSQQTINQVKTQFPIIQNLIKYDGVNDFETKVLNYYLSAWILSMGYEEPSNAKYFIGKCFNTIGNHQVPLFQKFYKNLGDPLTTKAIRIQFLINLCKNGWQFLYMQMIKQSKKHQNHTESSKFLSNGSYLDAKDKQLKF